MLLWYNFWRVHEKLIFLTREALYDSRIQYNKIVLGAYMVITCSVSPLNNDNLPLTFSGGSYPIVLPDNIY